MTPARRRALVALLAGLSAMLLVAWTLGLVGPGNTIGTADNGDGARLFCGAGLAPTTPSAAWQGGVVMDFTRVAPCDTAQPSSALLILRVAAMGQHGFSLTRLGWLYAILVGLTTAAAAWAVTVTRFRSMWLLLPAVVPLLDSDFARLFVSTYGEPAGLLGAFALVSGLAVATATDVTHRAERFVALGLLLGGGVVAGLAKVGYLPVLLLGLIAAAAVGVRVGGPRWTTRVVGPATVLVVAALVLLPVQRGLEWQRTSYPFINAHNLVYTVALQEMPGSAERLGLPAGAQDSAGQSFDPKGPVGVEGADVVAADPARVRRAAISLLAHRPSVLARVVGIGLQATGGSDLDYLPSRAWAPDAVGPPIGVAVSGAQGTDAAGLREWLGGIPRPWLPSVVTIVGILAGIASLIWRRLWFRGFGVVAGACSACALALVLVAVLGDGYFEIAKHVWLAAYLLDVALLALVGLGVAGAWYGGRWWWDRRASTASPMDGEQDLSGETQAGTAAVLEAPTVRD